jgi:hypothetical protein
MFTGHDVVFLHAFLTLGSLSSEYVDISILPVGSNAWSKYSFRRDCYLAASASNLPIKPDPGRTHPTERLIYVPWQACQALQAIDGLPHGGAAPRSLRFEGAKACSDCRGLSSLQGTQTEVRWLEAELFQLYELRQYVRV